MADTFGYSLTTATTSYSLPQPAKVCGYSLTSATVSLSLWLLANARLVNVT